MALSGGADCSARLFAAGNKAGGEKKDPAGTVAWIEDVCREYGWEFSAWRFDGVRVWTFTRHFEGTGLPPCPHGDHPVDGISAIYFTGLGKNVAWQVLKMSAAPVMLRNTQPITTVTFMDWQQLPDLPSAQRAATKFVDAVWRQNPCNPVVLGGHSTGAAIAAYAAAHAASANPDFAERLKCLYLLGPLLRWDQVSVLPGALTRYVCDENVGTQKWTDATFLAAPHAQLVLAASRADVVIPYRHVVMFATHESQQPVRDTSVMHYTAHAHADHAFTLDENVLREIVDSCYA